MFLTCILITVFIGLKPQANAIGRITCQNSEVALIQLESYYTWYYRCYRICLLGEDDRRRICAEVVKACLRNELKQVTVDQIEDEIEYVGVCSRRDFFIELPEGGFYRSRKRMFRCGSFTVLGEKINGFYVSAAGKPGAALIFTRVGKTVRTSYITVSYLVKGLMYHLWPFMYRPKYLLPDKDDPVPTEEN